METEPDLTIEHIRERVRAGNYLVKSHAVHHAVKEGFERKHIVEAILNGRSSAVVQS